MSGDLIMQKQLIALNRSLFRFLFITFVMAALLLGAAAYYVTAHADEVVNTLSETLITTDTPTNKTESTTASPAAAASGAILGGDVGLACQAVLCLSSSTSPSECNPSLNKYYSFYDDDDWGHTMAMRQAFLNLCPR
jgi:TrbM